MLESVFKRLNAIKKISVKELFYYLFQDKEFQELIIELNTIEQLYKHGTDATGKSIGEYSYYTKLIKKEQNKPSDRVTLKDTGYFYESFRVHYMTNYEGEILITADTIKEGGVDLIEDWGKDIVGLSSESLTVLSTFAKTKIKEIGLKLINMPQ